MKGGGRGAEETLVVVARADDAVRTDEAALPALDAEILFPDWHFVGNVALLIGAGAGRKGAVGRNQADGNVVAASNHQPRGHLPHEVGRGDGHDRRPVVAARHRCRNLDLEEALQRSVDRGKVLRDHGLALTAIGFANRFLDVRNCRFARQNAGNREEAGLKHRVGARAETDIAGDLGRIDDEEAQAFFDDLALHGTR
jgi:hypothetical protein